jgi:hypothetical protein
MPPVGETIDFHREVASESWAARLVEYFDTWVVI